MKKNIIKGIYIGVGVLGLILGVIGAIMPIIPGTPFFILALYCFSRGSRRFNEWFRSTWVYKKHLSQLKEKKEMTLRAKVTILGVATFWIGIGIVFAPMIWVKVFLILLISFQYYYLIFRIKTI